MLKFLPIVLVVLIIVGGVGYIRFTKFSKDQPLPLIPNALTASSSVSDGARIKVLEEAVLFLSQQIGKQKSAVEVVDTSTASSKSLEDRVTGLELSLTQLIARMGSLEAKSSTTASSAVAHPPAYIPLDWKGSSSSMDWTTITGQQITTDLSDYSGYKNVVLEVQLQIYQGNGAAYARIFNKDDGTVILLSEVSTSSGDYVWLSSSGFNFPSGKKTYQLQLKTSTGYAAMVQNARIKVNF